MEQGFDFGQLKWIVIFAVFVIYKFLSAKPKVDNYDTQEGEMGEEEEPMMKRLEELFGEGSMQRAVVDEKKVAAPTAQNKPKRVVPTTAQGARTGGLGSEVSVSQIGEDSSENMSEIIDDFDLKKAVIMSEILTRKYDE